MIKIHFKGTGVSVEGHADARLPDHSDVCAHVTATVHNFVVAFAGLSDKPLHADGDVSEGGGRVVLDWGNAPDAYGSVLIQALYLQLSKLARDCPEHITFDD